MIHTTTDEEMTGQAALYALGALDGAEARAFEEHVAAGCEACSAELREFESVVSELGLAATPVEPPAGIRARLLALISEDDGTDTSGELETGTAKTAAGDKACEDEASDDSTPRASARSAPRAGAASLPMTNAASVTMASAADFLVVRAGEGKWVETEDTGVSYKLLFEDRERGTFTTLVRMEPGARMPKHRHLGVEQCLVLEGDVRSGGIEMSAGDFNCSLPGSVHDELITKTGTLLLIVSPERYEVIEPRSHSAA
jgi:anti-sigma factor ChrR (cupin superfamily)